METKLHQEDDPIFGAAGRHKPCRACTDFKTWTKNQKEHWNQEKQETEPVTQHANTGDGKGHKECPVNREELGRHSWSVLHTMAAYYPEKPTVDQQKDMKSFMSLFSKFYPCEDCAKDFQDSIKESPPATDSRRTLSRWLCGMHNLVNRKLAKPEFDCDLVDERWREGWKDGSCN